MEVKEKGQIRAIIPGEKNTAIVAFRNSDKKKITMKLLTRD